MNIVSLYEYVDWTTYPEDSQEQLDRLNLHIAEVARLMSAADSSGNGVSIDYTLIQKYHSDLLKQRATLKKAVARRSTGSLIRMRPRVR